MEKVNTGNNSYQRKQIFVLPFFGRCLIISTAAKNFSSVLLASMITLIYKQIPVESREAKMH